MLCGLHGIGCFSATQCRNPPGTYCASCLGSPRLTPSLLRMEHQACLCPWLLVAFELSLFRFSFSCLRSTSIVFLGVVLPSTLVLVVHWPPFRWVLPACYLARCFQQLRKCKRAARGYLARHSRQTQRETQHGSKPTQKPRHINATWRCSQLAHALSWVSSRLLPFPWLFM